MTKEESKAADIVTIARAAYDACVTKDRAAIERLIAPDFHFTSPVDNRIDRETYFARCWPNSAQIAAFNFINLVTEGDRVFVTYEGLAGTNGFSAILKSSPCAKTKLSTSKSISVGRYHTKRNPAASWKKVPINSRGKTERK